MWKKIAIVVVVIAVIAAVGVFIADRTIFAPSQVTTGVPVAPTLAAQSTPKPTQAAASSAAPAATAPAASAPASGSSQVYKIDPAQSEVHYEVGETFLDGNRFNLAIGRTKGVAGEIAIDTQTPANSQIGEIVIDVSQFTSDENRRDNFIRRTGLESSKYPQATFKTTSIAGLPAKVNDGEEVTFTITGDLTVKETTKPVTWQVKLKLTKDNVSGQATTQITLSDFGAGPLKLPILSTEDSAKLVFDFVAVPAQ
jgi:polyisoprenoid-binding protein YceI